MQVHCFDMFSHLSDEGGDCQNASAQGNKLSVRKIVIIFLPINLNLCFRCSKDDGSFEYQQHMFLLRNKKNLYL